jgi:hypothetical protein
VSDPQDYPNVIPLLVALGVLAIVYAVFMQSCYQDCERRGGKLVRSAGCDGLYECVEPAP